MKAFLVPPICLVLIFFMCLTAHAQSTSRNPMRGIGPQGGPSATSGIVKPGPEEAKPEGLKKHWLEGDEDFKDQVRSCYQLSSTLIQHIRDIKKMTVTSPVNWSEVSAQVDDLQRGIQTLNEQQDAFTQKLNNGQRHWWEATLQKMTRAQLIVPERVEEVRQNLAAAPPEPSKTAGALNRLEEPIREWNQSYKQVATDINVQNLERGRSIRGLPSAQNPPR